MAEVIPDWALKAAYERCEREDAYHALARIIARHEQPPVDPDVIALREIIALSHEAEGYHEHAARVSSGADDQRKSFQAALAAYRKHKEAGK